MTAKQIFFRETARAQVLAGVNSLAKTVRVTLGPSQTLPLIPERPSPSGGAARPGLLGRGGALADD